MKPEKRIGGANTGRLGSWKGGVKGRKKKADGDGEFELTFDPLALPLVAPKSHTGEADRQKSAGQLKHEEEVRSLLRRAGIW